MTSGNILCFYASTDVTYHCNKTRRRKSLGVMGHPNHLQTFRNQKITMRNLIVAHTRCPPIHFSPDFIFYGFSGVAWLPNLLSRHREMKLWSVVVRSIDWSSMFMKFHGVSPWATLAFAGFDVFVNISRIAKIAETSWFLVYGDMGFHRQRQFIGKPLIPECPYMPS